MVAYFGQVLFPFGNIEYQIKELKGFGITVTVRNPEKGIL